MEKSAEKDLLRALKSRLLKENNLLNYTLNSTQALVITRIAIEDEKSVEHIEKTEANIVKGFTETAEALSNHEKNSQDFQFEFAYRLLVQFFEEFMFEVFEILFRHYPKLLKKEKFEINFDDIFEQDDIEYARLKIIQARSKKYIQSSNIRDVISKYKTVFGIKVELHSDDLDTLLYTSKVRNILTHNNGIVNDFFITELKRANIPTHFAIGDSVIKEIKKGVTEVRNVTNRVSKQIVDQIISSLPQIEKYEEGQ